MRCVCYGSRKISTTSKYVRSSIFSGYCVRFLELFLVVRNKNTLLPGSTQKGEDMLEMLRDIPL